MRLNASSGNRELGNNSWRSVGGTFIPARTSVQEYFAEREDDYSAGETDDSVAPNRDEEARKFWAQTTLA
jgi:hypothetical protein